MKTYRRQELVDFVVIGSGAAGGVIAKELSTRGHSVVVLEQGPFRRAHNFTHDELNSWVQGDELCGSTSDFPVSFRKSETDKAQAEGRPIIYARGVGGSSVHFTANFWRLRPLDFNERSRWGSIAGTGFADWPITYDELEPYYTKVDWEIGVSGAHAPSDPPRSRPYPMPPLPVKSSGALLAQGARKLGLHAQPAPMAILSRQYDGRPACMHCGYCIGYGCEFNAKSSTLATVIPKAIASGKCEIRPNSAVFRLVTGADGRLREVLYYDEQGRERAQRARAFVLSANGAETPRLLLMSGLANSSGKVGKYLMFNTNPVGYGLFEHPLNEYKSVQVTRIIHDFYDADPGRGFYGGGGIDGRMFFGPLPFALWGGSPGSPRWGAGYKAMLGHEFTRTMMVNGHTTSLPLESNNITLDPDIKDKWGLPAIRLTYKDHPDDLKTASFLLEKGIEVMQAAGAQKTWQDPVVESTSTAHLLGTCRMGNNPADSVVDKYHRSHEVRNLFICDGSSMVTSGRGQPTMTIQALAFRAGQHISEFARRGEI